MANRPVFVPQEDGPFVEQLDVEFAWFPGMSVKQKQRSIGSLHEAARASYQLTSILEISSKSLDELGVELSAFQLELSMKNGHQLSVENAFQGSKVFRAGGPYVDLYGVSPKAAKKDPRLRESGDLKAFSFEGRTWPLRPSTLFYDWLYLNALAQNPDMARCLLGYEAFTDIEFNPKKSVNCQAYSAALYVSLSARELLDEAMKSPDAFQKLVSKSKYSTQPSLFFD
ncbi:MAG: hypothetical protein ABEK03_11405 [Candidatus Bipolaricaulia bacterium]